MKIKIKRFDKSLPLPEYKTAGAVACDLSSRIDINIPAKSFAYIPLNVVVKIPENCFGLLAARSGTHKLGIMPVNGVGVIDRDYCGEEDELKFAAYNFTDLEINVERGTRVAQLLIVNQIEMEIEEVERMEGANRGGFGSTGVK